MGEVNYRVFRFLVKNHQSETGGMLQLVTEVGGSLAPQKSFGFLMVVRSLASEMLRSFASDILLHFSPPYKVREEKKLSGMPLKLTLPQNVKSGC